MVYIKSNLIVSGGNMYLTVDIFIEVTDITYSNNITFRKFNVRPHGFDKMYMNKDLIDDKLYQMIK